MKKRGKQVVALAAALALSCSMMMGYAAGNTAEIVSVTAVRTLPGGGTENIVIDKGATPSAGTLTQVSEADLITVTIKLTAGADPVKAAEATFFSFLNESGTLDNTTIQFVDQKTTGDDGTVAVTFRPRAGLENAVYAAKAGGTDVASPTGFYYTTAAALVQPTMADSENIKIGEDAVFNISNYNEAWKNALTAVKVGTNQQAANPIENEKYTIAANGETATLTIDKSVFTNTGIYTVVIEAGAYENVSASVTVEALPPIVDDQLQEALNNLNVPSNISASVDLPANVTTDTKTYDVVWTYEGGLANYLTGSGNAVTFNTGSGKFSIALKATASVANSAYSKTFTIYAVEGTPSFGNVIGISDADGADVFASTSSLTTAKENPELKAQIDVAVATALNVALGRQTAETLAGGAATLDFDGSGTIELSEYRIFKLMVDGADGFDVDTVKAAIEADNTNALIAE